MDGAVTKARLSLAVSVDWRTSLSLAGTIIKWFPVPLAFPLFVAVYYRETAVPIAATMGIAAVTGFLLERLEPEPELEAREGYLMVAVTWLFAAVLGALPFIIAGTGTIGHPVNALFESMSGFTTTGATTMTDISTETHLRSVLIWRQQTQWLGGIGIIVVGIAVLAQLAVGGIQLMEAEVPGTGVRKLTPRIAATAGILWWVYFGITAIQVGLLYGLHVFGYAPNMDLYNAIAHAFTTIATGGFSPEARSIEAFSPLVQWIIIPFMILGATNFILIWHAATGNPRQFLKNSEFKFYITILAVFTTLTIGILTITSGALSEGTLPVIREATFNVVSIVTTTGYASVDFDQWPGYAKIILFVCMFLGGSSGSTTCSIMMVRWLVVTKSLVRDFFKIVHPEAIRPVRFGETAVDEKAVHDIYVYTLLSFMIVFVGSLLVGMDAARVNLEKTEFEIFAATAATFLNIGPAFGSAGPMESYAFFPTPTKLLMILLMWIGRLEVFTVLVLFTPAYWRS